jgi:hypothetical protein
MSAASFSFDSDSPRSAGVPDGKRPRGLTVICVIAIVLGGLGLLASLGGIAKLAADSGFQQSFMPPQGPGGDQAIEIQRLMQQKRQVIANRYWWPNMGFALANLVVAGGMLAGGIMALNRFPAARALLLVVFAVAVPFEVSRSVVNVLMQRDIAVVLSDLMPRLMETSPPAHGPNARQAAEMGEMAAKVVLYLGLAFTLAFSLAKLIFYAVGCSWMGRPAVRQWLGDSHADGSGA